MTTTRQWTVDLEISEEPGDRVTRAQARLWVTGGPVHQAGLGHQGGPVRAGGPVHEGVGHARRHPIDTKVPGIGDELAVARALSALAHELLHAAVEDIQAVTRERVTLGS